MRVVGAGWGRTGSVRATIHPACAPGRDLGPPAVTELVRRQWERDFGGWAAVLDRDATVARFTAHNDSVRAQCPPGRLVEWSPGDGWGPLCAALGVPVPAEPFRTSTGARTILPDPRPRGSGRAARCRGGWRSPGRRPC